MATTRDDCESTATYLQGNWNYSCVSCTPLPSPIAGQCDSAQKAPAGKSNCLLAGQMLGNDEYLYGEGENGDTAKNTQIKMQSDGNLVLYQGNGNTATCDGTGMCPIWSSQTNGHGCPSGKCKFGLHLNKEVSGTQGPLAIVLEEVGDKTQDSPIGTVIWNGGDSTAGALVPGGGQQYPSCCASETLCPNGKWPKNSQGVPDQALCGIDQVSKAVNYSVPATYPSGVCGVESLKNTEQIKNLNWVILQSDGNIVGYHNPDDISVAAKNCVVWALSTQVV